MCGNQCVNYSAVYSPNIYKSTNEGILTIVVTDETILKSPNDKNLYKTFVLENGLKVVLIQTRTQDEENIFNGHMWETLKNKMLLKQNENADKIKMSAAGLCVGVGHFSDPPDLPGLAHFLEHLLFMGSEKYPKENHYGSFIYENGGNNNAVTGCERTTYFMEVGPQNFKEALDIFANCFKSPLLRVDSMDREVEAVDSEFQGHAGKDNVRISYILSDAVIPGHPMSKFSCGNKKTLKDEPAEKNINVNAELRKFYNKYYSANNMTLTVQSTEPLIILERWVIESFSDIYNNGAPMPYFGDLLNPFKSNNFHKMYRVKAVIDSGELIMSWSLPPLLKHYRTKPMTYLGYQIGHEGKGSILSYLKKRCWATRLTAGYEGDFSLNSTGSLFHVRISLTEKGGDHIYEVLTIVLKFITMLRKCGPQEAYFMELKTVADAQFQHKDQVNPIENVMTIAENMQLYPTEHYITGNHLIYDYDPQIISECLKLLTPELLNIRILSCNYRDSELDKTEKWTNCKYRMDDIPADWLESWKDLDESNELYFPIRNKFISSNFELKQHEDPEHMYPRKIIDDEYGCVWFKEDRKFQIPKAIIKVCLNSPIVTESNESANKMALFHKMLQYILAEDVYSAAEAGLNYSIEVLSYGIIVSLDGFNDKIAVLLEEIMDHITKFEASEELFEVLKNDLFQDYDNILINPSHLSWSLNAAITLTQHWTYNEKRTSLHSITTLDLNEFVKQYFSSFYIDSYYHGNLTKEEVVAMNEMIRNKIQCTPVSDRSFMQVKTVKMPDAISVCRVESYNKTDEMSIIRNCYQLGPYDLIESCKSVLFMELMEERCFDTLRTKEKLGYLVCSYLTFSGGIFAIEIYIECPSNKYSVPYIDERIEEFIKTFKTEMSELTDDKFKNKVSGIITYKKQGDLHMGSEVARFWEEIVNKRFIFNRRELEIEYYENLKLQDFKIWIKETIEFALSHKKKLSIQVIGPSDEILKKQSETGFENSGHDDNGKRISESIDVENINENKNNQDDDEEQVEEIKESCVWDKVEEIGNGDDNPKEAEEKGSGDEPETVDEIENSYQEPKQIEEMENIDQELEKVEEIECVDDMQKMVEHNEDETNENEDGELKETEVNNDEETNESEDGVQKETEENNNEEQKEINDNDEQNKVENNDSVDDEIQIEENYNKKQREIEKNSSDLQKENNYNEQVEDCARRSTGYAETNSNYENNSTYDTCIDVTEDYGSKAPVSEQNEKNHDEENQDCIEKFVQYKDMTLKFLADQINSNDGIHFISNIEEFKSNLPVYELNAISP